MSAAEQTVEISAALVRRLIAAQHPRWSAADVRPVISSGTDNAVFRLGRDHCARMPRRESAASQAEREQRWLPRLAPGLPLAIPAPVAAGAPAEGYPWAWSICPWMEGDDAATTPPDRMQAAEALGGFLAALRGLDATGGPAAGRDNHGRGVPLALLDKRVRQDVAALGEEIDGPAVLRWWDEALAAAPWAGPGVWVHGDLHPSNLLVRDGKIAGVLDFGLLGVGDPACDLFVAWSLLDAPARRVFRDAAAMDEAGWLRGRGWAIFNAVIALAFYLKTNPVLCAMSRRTLAELRSE